MEASFAVADGSYAGPEWEIMSDTMVAQDMGSEARDVPSVPKQISETPVQAVSASGSAWRNLFFLLLVAVVGGLGWAFATSRLGEDHRATLPPESNADLPSVQTMLVTAAPVTVRSVKRTIEAVGTLYGFEEIVVSAKSEGRVLRVLRDVADRVSPNELLIEIDPTDLRLSVAQSESNLRVELAKLGLEKRVEGRFDLTQIPTVRLAQEKRELARLKMERVQKLDTRQAVTQEAVDNSASEYRMSVAEYENQLMVAKSGVALIEARQAALAIAEQQLKDTQVRAPIPQVVPPSDEDVKYVITKRSVAEGTFLRVGDEICRLVIDCTLKLRVAVPERHSSALAIDQKVDVYIAGRADPFQGIVTKISPSIDTKSRTFQVEIQVKNERFQLKPGGFAKAIIETSRDENACTVPLAAMMRYAGVIKLFVVNNDEAREVQFRPGVQTAEWVEVAEPKLNPHDMVITSGQFNLSTGAKVSIRNSVGAQLEVPDERDHSATEETASLESSDR